MARIYANENIPRPVVLALRDLGHDVLTTTEAGNANQALPDDAVLAYACAVGRILLTLNRRHFVRLHTTAPDHCSIIVCSFDPNPTTLAERVHAAIVAHDPLTGLLIRVNRPA